MKQNLIDQKVLVTGSGGFIGSHLVEELVISGAQVTAMVHYNSRNDWGNLEFLDKKILDNIEVVTGDIQDSYFINKITKEKNKVFHLAALIAIPYSYDAPLTYIRTNVEGTANVMQACLINDVDKVIHTSTSETYGTAMYTPIDENHPLQGQSPYSATKIGADKIAESYFRSFGLRVTTVRPFNTYGPRQSARAVIPTIISQAIAEKCIKLGSLIPLRDLTYVKDTVNGFILASQSDNSIGEVINIGNGKAISIGDLALKILALMNCDKVILADEVRVRPEASEVYQLLCNNTKAKNLISWEPKYNLEQGLMETIDFIKANLDRYKTSIYNK